MQIGNILHKIGGEIMNAADVFLMMDHKYALFGLFFAFHNRHQSVGDSFYDEINTSTNYILSDIEEVNYVTPKNIKGNRSFSA